MRMASTSFRALEPGRPFVPPVGAARGAERDAEEAAEMLEYLASISMPGGGLWSTAGDLTRFARAYLRGGSLDGSLSCRRRSSTSSGASRRAASSSRPPTA